MKTCLPALAATVLVVLAELAAAQMPPDIAKQLRAIGPVINPAATAALYAARATQRETAVNAQVQRDIAYGPDERHLLDLFVPFPPASPASAPLPAARPMPVLVFVHGGAFVAGNRRTAPGSPFYDNVMLWAIRHGMVGVNMTYRLAPQNPWPAGPQDIGLALRWVGEHAHEHGADPSRVFLLGHSAGASHVAAYVANPRFAQGGGLAGVMLLSGVYQVTPELVAQSPSYPAYYGSDSSRYTERSSLQGLVATSTPLWIGGAELDPPQFKTQADLLRDALRNAGKAIATTTFADHNHMSQAFSIGDDDASVGNALLAFVKAH